MGWGGGVTSKFYRRTRDRSSGEKCFSSCFNVYFPDKHLRSHEFSEGGGHSADTIVGGPGGIHPEIFFEIWVSETAFPAF